MFLFTKKRIEISKKIINLALTVCLSPIWTLGVTLVSLAPLSKAMAVDLNMTELFKPTSAVYDITMDGEPNKIATMQLVDKILVQVDAISGLAPREVKLGNCGTTGCPVDAVQCDAVTELPSCPSGSALNPTRDMCQKDPDVFECPIGFTYDNMIGKCVKSLECPNGGEYNVSRNRCEYKRIYECPVGYTQEGNICVAPPICPSGAIFNSTTLKCEIDATYACADAGWTYEAATNKCWIAPPTCPAGFTYNTTYDKCFLNYTKGCPSGYTYNSTRTRCEKTPPDCPAGTTYNATTNRCEQGAGSACTLSGGTWNGSSCTVGGNYAATGVYTREPASGEYYTTTLPPFYKWVVTGSAIILAWNTTNESASGCGIDWANAFSMGASTSLSYCGYTYYRGTYISTDPSWGWAIYGIYRIKNTPDYTCPSGGILSGTTCNTTSTVATSCPAGYTNDNAGKCYANPTCPSSGSFDGNLDLCYIPFSKDCSSGTYDAATDSCLVSYTPTCASGYAYNSTRDRCEKTPPDCPAGTTYNSATNRCEQGAGSACTLSGGTWNGSSCTVEITSVLRQCQIEAFDIVQPSPMNLQPTLYSTFTPNSIYLLERKIGDPSSVITLNAFSGANVAVNSSCDITSITGPLYSMAGTLFAGYVAQVGGSRQNVVAFHNLIVGVKALDTISSTTSTVATSCPAGYTNDNAGKCYANPTCPSSGSFDGNLDVCFLTFAKSCTNGIYDAALNRCLNNATCPKGVLNPAKDRCEQDYVPVCGTGWTFNSATQFCEKLPVCIVGIYSNALDKCIVSYAKTCPSGLTLNTTTNRCEATPNCVAGTTFNGTTNVCEANPVCSQGTYNATYNVCLTSYTPTCASGYAYNSTRDRCEKTPPDCPVGTTYNSATNRCEQGAGSACTLSGGTWNGTDCTVSGSYAATNTRSTTQCSFGGCTSKSGVYNCTKNPQTSTVGTSSKVLSSANIYLYCNSDGSMICSGACSGSLEPGASMDAISGFIFRVVNNTSTSTTYTCPSGGTLSGTTCINTTTVATSCPAGYTNDNAGKCYANPTCPSSGSFDGNLDVCFLTFAKSCPSGMTYDSPTNSCIMTPACSYGTLNTSTDKCGIVSTCPSASTLDTSADKCFVAFTKTCTTGTYDVTNDTCAIAATCDGGTLNTTLDKCQLSRDVVCAIGTKDLTTGKCTFISTCQANATLVGAKCTNYPIPLTCPSGTDTTLDVCYSNANECFVATSYTFSSTLAYSSALKICVVEEKVVCALGLTWSDAYTKCEAVPICYNGMYNPENDFCYISTKECPINAAYPCVGPIGNKWCSPYSCNSNNQCGYAKCSPAMPPTLTEEPSELLLGLAVKLSDSVCMDMTCYFSDSTRVSWCGTEKTCPKGFGVFTQNGNCYQEVCPPTSQDQDGACYELK